MSKFRYMPRMAIVCIAALLLGASLSAGQEYARPWPAPKQAVAEGTSTINTRATSPATARTRHQSVSPRTDRHAMAKSKQHHLVLQVNTNDPAAMNLTLNNAMNVTQYYKDIGDSVKIEVIAFGPGLHMFREDTSPVKARIETMALSAPEVSFKACGNTQENMRKAENKDIPIIPQAQVVKSGVVRVMELEEQGWAYVKP